MTKSWPSSCAGSTRSIGFEASRVRMNSPAPSPFDRRPLVGIFALVLLALGAAVWWWSPENAAYLQFLRGAMIAGVIWLALPELQNPKNRWWMLGLLGAVLAVLLLPRYWSVI